MSNLNEGIQPNTVSYWEERTINIGDYESRKFGLSISKKTTYINKVDKKVTLSASDTVSIYPNQKEEDVAKEIMKKVKNILDDQEFTVRSAVNDHVDTPNLHKVKDLIGVTMEDMDDIESTKDTGAMIKAEKKPTKKVDEFEDVDFDFEDDEELVEEPRRKK